MLVHTSKVSSEYKQKNFDLLEIATWNDVFYTISSFIYSSLI